MAQGPAAFIFYDEMVILTGMLKGKKILLGITASIAAYKSILITRQLVKMGAEVKVIMTPAARDFVSPLTLSTLSKNPVLIELATGENWANHVMLGRWADVMLIAPLSCNTLAKMMTGQCDNLLLAAWLSATRPVVVAPAMDEDMWHHAATRSNLERAAAMGVHIIPVEKGELASGLFGDGRMAEPENIAGYIAEFLNKESSRDMAGKRVLVTAGPTYEAIDPVRFIGNHSSGKMGIAIAKELKSRGAQVTLVAGPVSVPLQELEKDMTVVKVKSAAEMYDACHAAFADADITIMAAAVADYMPVEKADQKIKKKEEGLTISLKRTPDILKSLGEIKKEAQVLVGFALETNNERQHALEKLSRKKADMIVLNSMQDDQATFGYDTNKVTIFTKKGTELATGLLPKEMVAKEIVNSIIRYIHA